MSGSPKTPHIKKRQQILNSLKRWGPSTTRQLSDRLGFGIGPTGTLLSKMGKEGLIKHNGSMPRVWEAL